MRVSVVVPVWNPGPNLSRCTDSILGQTMPAVDYELIFVDDGSTDGTGRRLDELAAAQPGRVRVEHIPNSGWPGRPRNVGLDLARGEYVHFVDNDDVLPAHALTELYAAAVEDGADVAFGRSASDFRGLDHRLYRTTLRATTLAEHPELANTLTPHKMFRREFLHRHGIRFPEGRIPLEDQFVVLPAFLHARSITVLADRTYYRYLRRIGSGRNAGDRPVDIEELLHAVGRLLDIVDAGPADEQLRIRLLHRFLRTNLLVRLTEAAAAGYDDATFALLITQIGEVVRDRIDSAAVQSLQTTDRAVAALLADRDAPALRSTAAAYRTVSLSHPVCVPRWSAGRLHLDVDAHLQADGEPLRCEAHDGGWALPEKRAPGTAPAERALDDAHDRPDYEVSVVSRADTSAFGIRSGLQAGVEPDGTVRVRGTVNVDPDHAFGGEPLADGLWDVRLWVRLAGFERAAAFVLDENAGLGTAWITADGTVVVWTTRASWRPLQLDVGQWRTNFTNLAAKTMSLDTDEATCVCISIEAGCGAAGAQAELLGEPVDVSCSLWAARSTLESADTAGWAGFTAPAGNGAWKLWLRLADDGARPAVRLPYVLTRAGTSLTLVPD